VDDSDVTDGWLHYMLDQSDVKQWHTLDGTDVQVIADPCGKNPNDEKTYVLPADSKISDIAAIRGEISDL